MRAIRLTVACAAMLVVPAGQALAGAMLSFTGGTVRLDSTGLEVYGYAFDVLSSTTIDQLGVLQQNSTGLKEAHEVGVWNPAGQLIASTTIGPGTPGTLSGRFRYVDVPDVTLGVGPGYVIGATNWNEDAVVIDALSVTTISSVAFKESRYLNTNGILERPTESQAGKQYFGPNILTTSTTEVMVPEPTSLAIFGLGALGLVAGRIRRRKQKAWTLADIETL